jgi:hypothetical protein
MMIGNKRRLTPDDDNNDEAPLRTKKSNKTAPPSTGEEVVVVVHEVLPTELMLDILGWLRVDQLVCASAVCHAWHTLLSMPAAKQAPLPPLYCSDASSSSSSSTASWQGPVW